MAWSWLLLSRVAALVERVAANDRRVRLAAAAHAPSIRQLRPRQALVMSLSSITSPAIDLDAVGAAGSGALDGEARERDVVGSVGDVDDADELGALARIAPQGQRRARPAAAARREDVLSGPVGAAAQAAGLARRERFQQRLRCAQRRSLGARCPVGARRRGHTGAVDVGRLGRRRQSAQERREGGHRGEQDGVRATGRGVSVEGLHPLRIDPPAGPLDPRPGGSNTRPDREYA